MHAGAAIILEGNTEVTPVIAIHGGAGTITRAAMNPEQEQAYHDGLREALCAGQAILDAGGSALDAVCAAVRSLEDCPLFNAGRGAVYTEAGTHELDASVMDGASRAAGAVAGVTTLRNPILAARQVMEAGEHVLLAGAGAEAYVRARGAQTVEPSYYDTEARHAQWQRARVTPGRTLLDHDGADLLAQTSEPIDPERKMGTVGAVACDRQGHVAAATSTGGVTNKRLGRVGDSPLIGAGCYADDATCAISATGNGEAFIRAVAAHDVAARMRYLGESLQQASEHVVHRALPAVEGRGGLIAVDAQGNISLPFNTEGMYRGYAYSGQAPVTAIYAS